MTEVLIVGHHGPWCEALEKSEQKIWRCNNHCPDCRVDVRVLGGGHYPSISVKTPSDCVRVASVTCYDETAHEQFMINVGKNGMHHLYDSKLDTVINSFPYIPLTGMVALQLALAWGAKHVKLAGVDMYKGQEWHCVHHVKPQQEYLEKLIEAGYVSQYVGTGSPLQASPETA